MSAQPAVTKLLQLNTGASIPQLGLGTWQSKPGEVAAAVDVAVRAGFRHLDCARVYQNEKEIGGALAKLFAEGVVKREDLFITSKLWNHDHAPEHVEQACRRALSDLGLAQLDLYLIHWPVSWVHKGADVLFPTNETGGMEQNPVAIIDTWKAMEALVDAGLVKAIGVSNFSLDQVRSLVENARIKPAVNQVEAHPCLPQHALAAGMAEWGILLQAYSTFGIGTGVKGLVHHKAIVAIAQQEGISAGELLLRWGLAQGYVVLSKSVTPARILANVATPLSPLSEQAMAALKEFGESHPLRVGNPAVFYTTPRPFFDDGIPIELEQE